MENTNDKTIQQADRFLNKVFQKFTSTEEPSLMTDIHLRASQDSGELLAFDDNDVEITRCVIDAWIENPDEDFYSTAAKLLRSRLDAHGSEVEGLCLLKPYSFVLENDDKEHIAELYVADDDICIIGGDIMEGWDKDLDSFLDKIMKED